MAEPRPVVVVSSIAFIIDHRSLGVGGFTSAQELTVLVHVNLQRNGVLIPRVVGSIGNRSDHLQGVPGVHLWHDFTANCAVWIVAVNRATRREIAIAAVDQTDEPVGAVGRQERPQTACFVGQACGRAVPGGSVGLERCDIVVVNACCIKSGLVVECRPCPEGAVAVVDGGVVVGNGVHAVKNKGSLNVHSVHDAHGERFGLIAMQVRERPLCSQFRRHAWSDFNVSGR